MSDETSVMKLKQIIAIISRLITEQAFQEIIFPVTCKYFYFHFKVLLESNFTLRLYTKIANIYYKY